MQGANQMNNTTRKTRSGHIFAAWEYIQCPDDFDYEALLYKSSVQGPQPPKDDIEDIHTNPGAAADNPPQSSDGPSDAAVDREPSMATSPSDVERSSPIPRKKKKKGAYKQSPANVRRRKRRQEAKARFGVLPTSPYVQKVVKPAETIAVPFDCTDLPGAAGGYSAKSKKIPNADVEYSREELENDFGFKYVPWSGRRPIVALDSQNRACMVFVGRPDDPSYDEDCDAFHSAMEKAGEEVGLSGHVAPHRRGHFPAVNVGVVHGNGTEKPINLDNKGYAPTVEKLLLRPDFQRLASFASASFAAFAPLLFGYYEAHLSCLFAQRPELKRIFPPHVSVFPTAAFNFGPDVWTYMHRDILNCAFGWCAIQALGRFDPKKGGHIVLWEARLIVEFPPGSLILIPSATITHSNIRVAPGDVRSSFTQYAPGGLFRYVDYGFQLEEELKKRDPKLYEIVMKERPDKWRIGLDLLNSVDVDQK